MMKSLTIPNRSSNLAAEKGITAHRQFPRLSGLAACLLCFGLAGLPAAPGCSRTEAVTETGNPSVGDPSLDRARLEVRMADGEFIVVGESGAVPAGAVVELTNEESGQSESVEADGRGAFEVRIAGEPEDSLSLTVRDGGVSEVFPLPSVGTNDEPGELDAGDWEFSCDQLVEEAGQRMTEAAAAVDGTCESDDDCVLADTHNPCVGGCSVTPASQAGKQYLEAIRHGLEDAFCLDFDRNGCNTPPAGCDPIDAYPDGLACNDGLCGARRPTAPTASGELCDSGAEEVEALLEVLREADTSCSLDEHCVIGNASLSCWTSCEERAISLMGQAEVEEARQRMEEEFCQLREDNECELDPGACLLIESFPYGVGCVEGSCAALSALRIEEGDMEQVDAGAGPATGPSYAETIEPIFSTECAPTCHAGAGSLGGVGGLTADSNHDLVVGAGYAALVGVPSLQVPTLILVGDSLESSYLWHKLNGTHLDVGGSGSAMPLGVSLDSAELQLVRAWIEGGAAP